jgi:hypothetical protein
MGVSGPVVRTWDEPAPLPLFVPTPSVQPAKTEPQPAPAQPVEPIREPVPA